MTTIPPLASGPHRLERRALIVDEGTVAVILRNGQVWQVRSAGRSGVVRGRFDGDRSMPALGELSYLLFENAPFTVELELQDVRLADGRRIQVRSTVRARPVWMDNPRILLTLAHEYGIRSVDRYTAAAAAQLEADFRARVNAALAKLNHPEIVTAIDPRATLGGGTTASDLLVIDNLNTVFTLDGVEMELEDLGRRLPLRLAQVRADNQVRVAEVEAEQELENLRAVLERVRAEHLVDRQRVEVLGAAETARLAAELYGVHPWTYSHPELAQQVDLARIESLRGLLTEYADTIPFLAETFGRSPAELLAALMGNQVPEPGPHALADAPRGAGGRRALQASGRALPPARWQISAEVAEAVPFAPELEGITGAAAVASSVGDQERLVIAAIAPGRPAAMIPLDSPYWRSRGYGRVTLCVVPETDDPAEAGAQLAAQAAAECGFVVSQVEPVPGTGTTQLRVALDSVPADLDPHEAASMFTAWKTAVETLLAGAGHAATVSLVQQAAPDA